MTFAATHPGKIGDALYALPTIREICDQTGEKCDFYTSRYCEPLRRLISKQSYINDFIIPKEYVLERMDMGVQPWYMPVDESKYSAVYQLGYRYVPDRPLHQFIALNAGIDKPLKICYNYGDLGRPCGSPYIVFAPRGASSYSKLFTQVAEQLIQRQIGIAVIGGPEENYFITEESVNPYIMDFTRWDMYETLSVLYHASGFVGLMSSQLVLANGFNMPKVAPHDNIHWDMHHVIYSDTNFYPINPSVATILELLGL